MPGKKSGAARKPWTVLVYMAGDNNLEQAGVDDLGEMKKIGSGAAINIVAQFDRPAGATRYFLRKGTTLARDAVKKLGKADTGDPAALVGFVQWGLAQYPADRVALVLWNHGQGWDDTDIYAGERVRDTRRPRRIRRAFFRTSVEKAAKIQKKGGVTTRAILLDDGAKDFLDNLEMKKVMSAVAKLLGRKLDLFGMDACLMSMAEVGYQVRDSVAYTVGSEETEPGEGWPYDVVLKSLAAKPSMDGEHLAKLVVDSYIKSYGRGAEVTQSCCDLSAATGLAVAVKPLATALKASLAVDAQRYALVDIRNRVQRYEVRDNVDLVDLCQLLGQSRAMPAAVKTAAAGVIAAVLPSHGRYVVSSRWKGDSLRDSNGVAIYFPTEEVSPLYAGLDWASASNWGPFVTAYIAATRGR